MKAEDFIKSEKPIALIIGHDPRLRDSDTIATYALFANYFFEEAPKRRSEKQKYGLAKSTFDQISYLTNDTIKPEDVFVTNLCNNVLPHAPKGKTVYINETEARIGVEHIKDILIKYPTIKYIFPMSLQVNYWLQELGLYNSGCEFVCMSEPKEQGINNIEPFYKPKKQRTFLLICGNQYKIDDKKRIVIPILHSKNFPLNSRMVAYEKCYSKIRNYFGRVK